MKKDSPSLVWNFVFEDKTVVFWREGVASSLKWNCSNVVNGGGRYGELASFPPDFSARRINKAIITINET